MTLDAMDLSINLPLVGNNCNLIQLDKEILIIGPMLHARNHGNI